jgi:hypothetical protein
VPEQKEDLEFSVGSKQAVWDVKDPLLAGSQALDYGYDDDGSSNMHSAQGAFHAPGGYGGGNTASLVGGVNGQQLYNQKPYGAGGRGYPPS